MSQCFLQETVLLSLQNGTYHNNNSYKTGKLFCPSYTQKEYKKGRQYNSSLFLPKNIYDDLWYDKVTANPRDSGLVEYTGAGS